MIPASMAQSILFLDVDGVLNRYGIAGPPMEQRLVLNLLRVVEQTQCAIVVSSAWRHGGVGKGSDFHTTLMGLRGGPRILDRVIGVTGTEPDGRIVEILNWLKKNDPIGGLFAVVDDIDMRSAFGESQVLTRGSVGLTADLAERLIELLTPATLGIKLPADLARKISL